jgi:hypothetical protein
MTRHLPLLAPIAVALCLLLGASRARAQDCGCDHTLALDVTSADGAALGIEPGDVVCLEPGERPFLRLSAFVGSADMPIVVTSCDGVATIRNTDRAYALVVEGQSQYLRVTGTNVDGTEYGIRVSAPDTEPYAGVGVWLQGRSSDVEVDHVEIFETGFAGVMAKTDPGCDDRAAWDGFVMRNIHLHHLWVHDTGGEGFYVGSTQAMGYARTCDGASVTIPAHFMENVEIDHVLIEDTGWDGAQIGFARSGCSFHDNVIRRVGSALEMYQQQGLQIGAYSSCEVRRNVLSDGPAMGIIVLDSGDSLFADNVIARFGGDGIYANLRDLVDTATYRVVHNTIVGFGGSALRVFGAGVDGHAWNNLVIGGDMGSIAAAVDVDFDVADNVFAETIAEAGVVGDDDFHLGDASPARGEGRDLTTAGFALDLDGNARAVPPSVGAYEHEADVPVLPDAGPPSGDAGASGTDAGATSDRDATTGAGDAGSSPPAESGGCGCRVHGSSDAPRERALVGVTLALAALVVRARARSRRALRRGAAGSCAR